MEGERPEYFYKYMTGEVAALVLQNRTLRWSTPGLFNDPFDVQFDLHVDVDREKLRAITLQKMWDAWFGPSYTPHPDSKSGQFISANRHRTRKVSREEFDKWLHDLSDKSLDNLLAHIPERHADIRAAMGKTKTLCFSSVGDSLPMWAYYSQNHQGAVLRFKPIDDPSSVFRFARPMKYSVLMPQLFDEDSLSDISAGLKTTDSEDLVNRLVFTKAKAWEHEQEWRLFLGHGRDADAAVEYNRFDALELDAVILGCAMTEDCRTTLSDLVGSLYPKTKVFRAAKSEREFKLVLSE
jgi:Protein of unknown function (DUF2971)